MVCSSLLWTLIAPALAWNYEQPWDKSIDLADTCNYWACVQKAESLSKSVAFSATLLAGICAIQSSFPKKIQTALLDHWLDPSNDIWTPQGMVASSSYLQTQIAARVSLNWMCSNAPKQSKLGPPAKRWADNVQKLLNALPVGAQRQHIEMFLKSALPIVEKVRAARCADPGVWLAMAPQLLPIMPNNEWTRYDLLPVRTPTAKLSASVCGKNHRALARLYAPTLTQTIDALTTDEEWANPGMIRQLVAKTYAAAKTTSIHAEQFELPADVGGELFF